MMKRILLIIISLNIIATPAQGWNDATSHLRPTPFSSRFNHIKPARSLSNPLSWNDVSNGLQRVMGTIRDAITDKRLYGPLSALANATKENVVAGMQKIGDIGSRISGYLAAKGTELSNSSSEVINVVMNTTAAGSNKKINAWQSGFMKAREQHTQKMREKGIEDAPSTGIHVIELEAVTHDEPVEVEPVLKIEQEPEAVHIVEPENKEPPVQEQPEPVPVQEILVQEIKEIVPPPKPVMVKEPVSIAPVDKPKQKKKKIPVVKEESITAVEKEEYQPVRKKRRSVVDQQDIDLFDVQSEFARPSPSANQQPSPFMTVPQPMPTYQQQMPVMQQQPMPFAAAPVYQANQNQLSNAAMQMHSSAMAMQMQAANLMAQAQQQQYMQPMMAQQVPVVNQMQAMPQYNQMMQQFNTPGLSKQEKTKQLMQYLYQLNESDEHNGQRLLLLIDCESDILEHLLASNTGQMVDRAVQERNAALKNSNQTVVAAYNMILDIATTCSNGDTDARLYHHFIRKSKRSRQSSSVPQGKRKFLMCVMYVLEHYYDMIEKMQQVSDLAQ